MEVMPTPSSALPREQEKVIRVIELANSLAVSSGFYMIACSELALRGIASFFSLIATALPKAQVRTTTHYLPFMTHAVMLGAPLLAVCSATWWGFACTFVFMSMPCCSAPVGLGFLSSQLLPQFGLPADLLARALTRPVWLALPSTLLALYLGPAAEAATHQPPPPQQQRIETAAFAAILLLTARIVWTWLRLCLLMPGVLMSSCRAASGPVTPLDRRLSELLPGGSCTVLGQSSHRFTVRRLRLRRGVEALAFIHPSKPHKWVVSLHGNGEMLRHYADAKLHLATDLGCSVIACDYREVMTLHPTHACVLH